jgi:hypothetical protein
VFISANQISISIKLLENVHPFFGMSFLAFKESQLPVGRTKLLNFSEASDRVLTRHYRPFSTYAGFYNPFRTSRPKDRWLRPRYGSTSLQRITKDTFGDALIHPNEREWGWRNDYVRVLQKHLGSLRISGFHLAIWLFREFEWPDDTTPTQIQRRLFNEYGINEAERKRLFEESVPAQSDSWGQPTPISEGELVEILGNPPGAPPQPGAALQLLRMRGVGPAVQLTYEPAERLNIVTGDNSLGKTFLLDCVWWALGETWLAEPATPRRDVPKNYPFLEFRAGTLTGRPQSFRAKYDWDRQMWEIPQKRDFLPGLAVYARYDGSFGLLDPARVQGAGESSAESPQHLALSSDEVWNGLSRKGRQLCSGLLTDWVLWQVGGARYAPQFGALTKCLDVLSPSDHEPLNLADPERFRESREIPTLRMPYGNVPITIASAGVKRIAALAYMLVWTWFEHVQNALATRRPQQQAIILLVDEVEAHLHPRWQRLIIPAIVQVVRQLAPKVSIQLHVATHSPMVLASAETIFDERLDGLYHLKIDQEVVSFEELDFVKRGTADAWLMSPVFGLDQPRSREAESAINDARRLQLRDTPLESEIAEVNARLVQYLAPDDEFWPRWRFFAKQHHAHQ